MLNMGLWDGTKYEFMPLEGAPDISTTFLLRREIFGVFVPFMTLNDFKIYDKLSIAS